MDLMFDNPLAFIYASLNYPILLIFIGMVTAAKLIGFHARCFPQQKRLSFAFKAILFGVCSMYTILLGTALLSLYTAVVLPPWSFLM